MSARHCPKAGAAKVNKTDMELNASIHHSLTCILHSCLSAYLSISLRVP